MKVSMKDGHKPIYWLNLLQISPPMNLEWTPILWEGGV